MEAKDFRHGNYINTPIGIQKVIDILCDSINTTNYEALPYLCITPIPLTEEILLKCGFEKTIWSGYNENKHFRQNFKYYGWVKDNIWCFISLKSLDENKEDKPHFFGRRLLSHIYEDTWSFEQREGFTTYVHQFQNLFFALTNEELEINL